MVVQLNEVKFKLKQAKIAKKLADIDVDSDDELLDEQMGKDIGIPPYDSHPMVAELKKIQQDAKKLSDDMNFGANACTFKIPSLASLVKLITTQ